MTGIIKFKLTPTAGSIDFFVIKVNKRILASSNSGGILEAKTKSVTSPVFIEIIAEGKSNSRFELMVDYPHIEDEEPSVIKLPTGNASLRWEV